MKTSKRNYRLILAAGVCLLSAWTPRAQANDWNAGVGDWSNAANWNGGIPNATGGWAIGNIGNNGTAIVSITVPNVSEAWAGNNGTAGNIWVTNGGTLTINNWLVVGRNDTNGNTPLSMLTVCGNGVLNKTNDNGGGFLLGDSANGKGQMIVKDSGIVNITAGWNGIGNGTGEGWLTLQDNAVYNVAGHDWNIGDYGAGKGHSYIKDNATLNVNQFWIGKGGTTVGAVWQTGGAIHGLAGGNEWTLGGDGTGDTASSGFYSLAAGSLDNVNNFQIGRYGKGLIYQTGGTLTAASWTSFGRFTGSLGVMWLTGGSFSHTGGNGTHLFVAENGRGEFTISGTAALNCNLSLRLGNPGGVGIINFNGGTSSVPLIEQTGGTGYANFNGGTVKANSSSLTFMTGLAEACVYSGNAVIDTAGNDVTVAQALVAPYGQGVATIPVADGGAGYMAPPIVQVDTSFLGSGATAVAQLDLAAGKVTNIVVTCSGYGYTVLPTVTFIGGGPTTAATAGTPTLGDVASGGLTKNGNGTLTLSGVNTYTNTTVVNAGKLVIPTALTAGACNVADGAVFGSTVLSPNSELNVAKLTLGASTLDFDLANFGNPTNAPLNVVGALTVNGAVSITIADALPQLGQFPLVKYGSRSGSGSFVIGSLPIGVVGTIMTNVGNSSIDLKITAVSLPRWDGQAGGMWDIGLTTNWVELSTLLPAYFAQGNAVVFDDAAMGSTNVTLNTTVNPSKVTVNNNVLSYILRGSGKISGSAVLIKQGTNDLVVNTVNDYTGATRIEAGMVSVTNLANGGVASAIGKSTSGSTNLILVSGTLSYSGPAITIDRGYSVQGTNSGIDVQSSLGLSGLVSATTGGSFIKTGPAQLTYLGAGVRELSGGGFPGYRVNNGAVLFDGTSGAQTNHNQSEMWVGGTPATTASLTLSNTILNVDSWLAISRGNGSVGNTSSVALYNSKLNSIAFSMGFDGGLAGNLVAPTLTLNGNSTFTNNGDMNLGESSGSTASILLQDTSALYSGWRVQLGWHAGAIGNLTLANSSTMAVNAWFSVANEGGTGTLTLKDNSSLWVRWDMNVTDVATGTGTLNIQNNAALSFGNCFVGKGVGSTAVMNQTGGSVLGRSDGNEMQVGFHGAGIYNMSAGSLQLNNHYLVVGRYADGPGEFNLSGGSIVHNTIGKRVQIGEDGTGVLNISGTGSLSTIANELAIGLNATGNGMVNLNGGSLQVRRVIGINGVSTFNFNGGVLRAGPNAQADFMSGITAANVLAGGAMIDTSSNNVSIAQALLDGTGGGGLTKTGNGTLALNGANTYTGTTTISAGTLGGNGTITGPVVVSTGATLAPGSSIGMLTLANTLNLAAGSTTVMELNKTANTNDSVTGISTVTYGGTLVLKNLSGALAANDTFKLFNATNYAGSFSSVVSRTPNQTVTWDISQLTVNGTVKVSSAVAAPVALAPVVSGGKFNLAWPANQIGWQLQSQVNALAVGLSTNWVPVAGSTTTNQVSLPEHSTEATEFFRLVFPAQ